MNLSLLRFFNSLAGKSAFLKTAVILISRPVGISSIVILALLPIFLTAKNRTYWLIVSVSTLGGAWVIAHLMKLFFRVARPVDGIGEIVVAIKQSGYSFPSEHASVFASLAVLGWFYDIRLGALLTVLALLVGISRIVAGVHYPLDVLTGFCVGTLVGLGICIYSKRFL
jgi:undecaprenyl-diphosphatase